LLLCFGGGVVGAALGGLFSFALCGAAVLVGCLVVLAGGSDFLLLQVGLGPVWGPHVGGFSAGVCAAAYAAGVRKNNPGGSGKDILSPLVGTSWDVLLVGGLVAVISHLLLQVLTQIPVIKMADCIALTIVIVQIVARLLFCKEGPFGAKESIKEHGLFGTNDWALSWVPWMSKTPQLVMFSLGVGLLSGGVAMGVKEIVDPMAASGQISSTAAFVVPLILVWSVAAATLVCLELGTGEIQKFPVWHCQAILAALAFLYTGSLVVAGVVGLLGGLLQEGLARLSWNHGSTHIDPPAFGIAVGTLLLNLAKAAIG
jgi:hypothetical protein